MTYHFPIKVGDRVALAPHLDLWMRGARFGKCVKVSTNIEGDTIYWIAPDGPTHRVWLSADDLLGAVRITSTTPMTPEAGSVLSPIEDDEDDDDPGI